MFTPGRIIRDRDELCRAIHEGRRFSNVLFWGHRPATDGEPAESCLSQWYPSPFEGDGIRYETAEHFMMARKARLFDDEQACATILGDPAPAHAKRVGRRVRGFDSGRWQRARFKIVVQGNLLKFEQHPRLRSYLVSTGEAILAEASPHDRIWGIGLGAEDARAENPLEWLGQNLLGFALMEVRARLRSPVTRNR